MIPEFKISKQHLKGQRVAKRRGRRAVRFSLSVHLPASLAGALESIAAIREQKIEDYVAEVLDAHVAGIRSQLQEEVRA